MIKSILALTISTLAVNVFCADAATTRAFLSAHCFECHDADTHKGGLDLTALKSNLSDMATFETWVKIHDRIADGEMPPKKEARPPAAAQAAFLTVLSTDLTAADRARFGPEGRATQRRLNRYEYEDTLRDLLSLPELQVKDFLPEDGESHRFNKVAEALDVSHVNMARYLNAADFALRQTLAQQVSKPELKTIKYYAREQPGLVGRFKLGGPECRKTFPVLGLEGQPAVQAGKAPATVGAADPKTREQEAVGIVVSTYEPTEIQFNRFKAPLSGYYKLRFSAYSIWVGGADPAKPWIPNYGKISKGRRDEPVTISSDIAPRLLRKLGGFDVTPEPTVSELTVWLFTGETIRPDAARFFRSRPPDHKNPLAEKDGMPGVAFKWMEVEGPLVDAWPPPGHKLLFGDLPMTKKSVSATHVDVESPSPEKDAPKLLTQFMARVYRRPVLSVDSARFLNVITQALKSNHSFTDSMLAGYTAVLCSPEFLYLGEKPGRLDDLALAERLSYFLWNSQPDDTLRKLALDGKLRDESILRNQTNRLMNDPKSRRFVNDFLDYWLELRKIAATAPDATLYPDYQLDDLLVESLTDETQLFFAELVKHNLGAKNLVASDFAMLNERLAVHYGIPGIKGIALRRVALPSDCVRGGLMTQASVLKVTANGTTTSPVIRGAWIMERVLGQKPPPPPPSVPAVEPDTRGATTIREQLDKHRNQPTCAACHKKIDPAGFALENFDTMGAWRDKYRALGVKDIVKGFGHNGISNAYGYGQNVDASGELPDGRPFKDVRELKALLLKNEAQLAQNLVQQLTVYATGAPVQFADRPAVQAILDRSKADGYGIRTLIEELVQSPLFREK
ncbi:MAG: DUF1592 domain-containing protein [Planctomycetota bacterium]